MLKQTLHRELLFQLDKIQDELGGNIENNNGISSLFFNNKNGRGNIKALNFENGWAVINIDVLLNRDIIFDLETTSFEALHFIYCLEGNCTQSSFASEQPTKLNELQSIITETRDGNKKSIGLKHNIRNVVNIICIDKEQYFTTTIPKIRLTKLLQSIDLKNKHIHLGSYNLKIASYIKELLLADESGQMTELMHYKGTSHLILASHIEQLYSESLKLENQTLLSRTELKKVEEISDLITTNPQEPYTVSSLCNISGLSPAKLQEGCKIVNNRTVSDFVRFTRLQKAEHLIKSSDLNISEIVYTIGFTSRSYFCKIFKAAYGCSPKNYRKKVNQKRKL